VVAEAEANYRLPDDYRLLGAVKYEWWKRQYPDLRQASWRAKTEEYSGRAQINKRLTETLGGSVAYIYSERDGSDFQIAHDPDVPPGVIDPIHWGDRNRQQWRLSMDWEPMQKLSLQGRVDGSLDAYHSTDRRLGPEDGLSHNASIDAAYQLTPDWNLNAFLSRNETTREQKAYDNDAPNTGYWTADLRNLGYAGGVGVRGKPREGLKLGADVQYSYDKSEYELTADAAGIVDLPDIAYRQFDLKLFADYEWSDNASIWLGYTFTHLENSDFTDDINILTDGTIIEIPDRENTHFIGVSYKYRW